MFRTLLLPVVRQIVVAFWINNIRELIVIGETDLFASLSHEKSNPCFDFYWCCCDPRLHQIL